MKMALRGVRVAPGEGAKAQQQGPYLVSITNAGASVTIRQLTRVP